MCWAGWLADLELKGALSAVEVAALNAELDAIPDDLPNQAWHGRVHRQDYQRPDGQDSTSGGRPAGAKQDWGVNLQNIVEAGPAFVSLVDHPSWLGHVVSERRGRATRNPFCCFLPVPLLSTLRLHYE